MFMDIDAYIMNFTKNSCGLRYVKWCLLKLTKIFDNIVLWDASSIKHTVKFNDPCKYLAIKRKK